MTIKSMSALANGNARASIVCEDGITVIVTISASELGNLGIEDRIKRIAAKAKKYIKSAKQINL